MTVGAAADDDMGVEAGSGPEPEADVDPLDVEPPEFEVAWDGAWVEEPLAALEVVVPDA